MFGGKRQRNGATSAPNTTTLEDELAALRERRAQLAARLDEASIAVRTTHDVRRAAFVSGDLGDAAAIAARDSACRDAENALVGLEDALAALDEKMSEAEQRLAAAQRSAELEANAALLEQQLSGLTAAFEPYATAGAELVSALAPLAARSPSAHSVHEQAKFFQITIADAVRALAAETDSAIRRSRAQAAEVLTAPPPPPAKPVVAPPPPEIPVDGNGRLVFTRPAFYRGA